MVRSTAFQWSPEPTDLHPQTFQSAMKAMDHPGTAVPLRMAGFRPQALNTASAAFLTAWLNPDAPVWTDLSWDSQPAAWLHEVSGCIWVTEPCMASIALITEPFRMPSLDQFRIGDPDRPEASTLLVIQVHGFTTRGGKAPAVEGTRKKTSLLIPTQLPEVFWKEWEDNRRWAPLGVDAFFTSGDLLVALPHHMRQKRLPTGCKSSGSPMVAS